MKSPKVVTTLLGVVCLAAIFGVLTQERELTSLRAEQKHVLTQLASESNESSRPAAQAVDKATESPGSNPELLQLRSEITRLTQRTRELAGVTAEHDKLSAQIAAYKAGGGPRLLLPSKARMAGYNTPEDTLETVLWALEHRDFTNFIQAFSPEIARVLPIQTEDGWSKAMDEFHQQFGGLSILNRKDLPDGRVELTVQLAGRQEPEQPLHLKQVNGQWKFEDFK